MPSAEPCCDLPEFEEEALLDDPDLSFDPGPELKLRCAMVN
jgi:hypothetical protein